MRILQGSRGAKRSWCTKWLHVALGSLALLFVLACPPLDLAADGDAEAADGDRDFIVQTTEDMVGLDGCENLGGRILFRESDVTSLVLPKLKTIDGSLEIWQNPSLQTVSLPELVSVDGDDITVAFNDALTAFSVPTLSHGANRLRIYENESLLALDLQGLATHRGALWVIRSPSLEHVNLSGLVQIDPADNDAEMPAELRLETLPALTQVSLDALETIAGNLTVADTQLLPTLLLPRLQTVEGSVFFFSNASLAALAAPLLSGTMATLSILDNPRLQEIDFAAIAQLEGSFYLAEHTLLDRADFQALAQVEGNVQIYNNAILTDLVLDSLEDVGGDLGIFKNPMLPQCAVSKWRDHILSNGGIGGTIDILGNDEEATCPD